MKRKSIALVCFLCAVAGCPGGSDSPDDVNRAKTDRGMADSRTWDHISVDTTRNDVAIIDARRESGSDISAIYDGGAVGDRSPGIDGFTVDVVRPDRVSPDRLAPDRLSPDRLSPDRATVDLDTVDEAGALDHPVADGVADAPQAPDHWPADSPVEAGLHQTAAPVFAIAPGTYDHDLAVEISSPTASATIFYTVDGTEPTLLSQVYSQPVPIAGNGVELTLKTIATSPDRSSSEVTSGRYTIIYPNTVFIDPSASSAGTGTYGSPYQRWQRVTFAAGYHYLQKRGTIAKEQVTVDASGTPDEVITLGAYGTGAKPIIEGAERAVSWTHLHDAIYAKTVGLEPGQGLGIVLEDGIPLKFLVWNSDPATTFVGATAGSFSYAFETSTVYAWATDGLSPDTHTMEVSRRYFGIHGNDVSHIRISDFHIRYTSLHGIAFEDGTYISVDGCRVEKLGGAVVYTQPELIQAGNGIEFGNSSAHCTVTNCSIAHIFDSGLSPQTYQNNQHAHDFVFANNTIMECGFAGIEISVLAANGASGSQINNVAVQNTEIKDCGRGWSGIRYGVEGRGIKVDASIVAGELSGVVIEDTTISGSAGAGVHIRGETGVVSLDRCRIYQNELDGVEVSSLGGDVGLQLSSSLIYLNGANQGANDKSGVAYNAPSGLGFRLFHNTFYDNASYGVIVWEHGGFADLMNNLFSSSIAKYHLVTGYTVAGFSVDNNYFQSFSAPIIAENILDSAAVYDDAETYNEQTHAQGNLSNMDPLLVSPQSGEFSLQSTASICYRAGTSSVGVTEDYLGNVFAAPPSIGALEYE